MYFSPYIVTLQHNVLDKPKQQSRYNIIVHKLEGKTENLNLEQLQAVTHALGPLLVVAGAGTGKTRVIVNKINKLLDEGAEPASILALTFTEKAAAEMLDRVLLSRSGLYPELTITTFNGFGESLLREFGNHIGLGRNFKLLSEQAQIVFMRERIAEFELDYFLPLSNLPDALLKDILNLFSLAKQQLVSPKAYLDYAKKLPATDEAAQLEKRQHLELATAYECYIRLCREENVIDYDDQIYLVVQLLEARPNIRLQIQQRFINLFVDEFQDTNPMQSRLIDLLVSKQQNITAVGDDDQSIYGFRGATLANILSFKDRYPKAKQIALTQNYRSSQALLDAAYHLIQHNNPDRLEATLKINKKLVGNKAGKPPSLKRFSNLTEELSWIAEDIAKRLKAGESPGNIAVLTRRRQTAQDLHEAMEQAGVTHRLIGHSQDLYKHPVVRMLTELSRTLAEPHNNESLYHTLTSDLFRISSETIAPLAAKARLEHELLEDLLNQVKNKDLDKALAHIKSWREQAAALSVGQLLYKAISECGYKDHLYQLAANDDEAGATIQIICQYFDTLWDFGSIAIQPTVAQYQVSLPALQAAGETTEDGTLDISLDDVSIMTVHKAKGLEWDTVYIPDVTENSFPTKKLSQGLRLPEKLKGTKLTVADEHYAEERRLMYVAVTRARENLVISFSERSKTHALRKPSRFIDELFGAEVVASTPVGNHGNVQQTLLDLPVSAPQSVVVPTSIYDGTQVHLSVSQAACLLECPLDFYYKYVLRAPESPDPRSQYGNQLHEIFQAINEGVKNDELKPLKVYLDQLKSGWQKIGYASKVQQERALTQAQATVKRFYAQAKSGPKPLFVEQPFRVVLENESITLRGRYDVIFEDEGVEIRDYKTTTSVNSEAKAKQRATASTQLTMYALAWQVESGALPDRLSLQFVDTDIIGTVRKTQKGIDGLINRLNLAITDLKKGNFPLGRGQHTNCHHQ